jgi:ornithine cyclodeaminase/alanine dehydrogenase-like protein (mu-crystallin family)
LLATSILLTRPPERIVTIGAGAQIAAHLSLFLAHYPSIKSVRAFNRSTNERLQQLVTKLGVGFPSLDIESHLLLVPNGEENQDLNAAVSKADIIITATPSTKPLFDSKYVAPGTHLCLIGSYTPAM